MEYSISHMFNTLREYWTADHEINPYITVSVSTRDYFHLLTLLILSYSTCSYFVVIVDVLVDIGGFAWHVY